MAEPLRHRQTKEAATDMFSLQPPRHISTLPKSGRKADILNDPLSCQMPLRASQQTTLYSITSSARVMSVGGTVRPSALAVLRLSTSSKLVGRTTGRSAGFSPLRIRPT